MSKTYLVALREYVENLRTKTFWIGILAFPALILVAIVVSKLMSEAKDVRAYAVLDRSDGQWVSEAVDELIAKRTLAGFAARAEREDEDDTETEPPTPDEIRAAIRQELDELPQGHALRSLLQTFLEFDDDELAELSRGEWSPGTLARRLLPTMARLAGDPEALAELKAIARGSVLPQNTRRVPVPDAEDREAALREMLQEERLFAYFVIGEKPLEGSEGFRYVSNNVTDDELRDGYARLATDVVQAARVARLQREKNLTEQEARLISAPVVFKSGKVGAGGKVEEVGKTEKIGDLAPVAFVYFLWIAVFTAAQMLLTNTIEEKSNRLIEVLLSSVSALQLMAGKIFGIAATGLTVVGSWVLCALLGVELLPLIEPSFRELELRGILGDPLYLSSFVAYFLAGYFFYAAILVGLGSVCNSLKEAQNLMQPVFLLLIVPLLAMFPVVNDPNGTLARILTYVPPFTPFLMMNRAAGPPPFWEYVLTSVVIVASILAAFWAAAKVFRIGILMTGKPPRAKEILAWLRAPIGVMPAHREHATHPAGDGGLGNPAATSMRIGDHT